MKDHPGKSCTKPNGDAPRQTDGERDHVGDATAPRLDPVRTAYQQHRRTDDQGQEFDVGDAAGFTGEEGQSPEQRVTPDPGFGDAGVVAPGGVVGSSDNRRESDTKISAAHGMNAKPWTTPRCTSWPIIAPEYAKLIAAAKDDNVRMPCQRNSANMPVAAIT
jgi:hypothetical protein